MKEKLEVRLTRPSAVSTRVAVTKPVKPTRAMPKVVGSFMVKLRRWCSETVVERLLDRIAGEVVEMEIE